MNRHFERRYEGATHSFVCELEPTNSGKQRGWYLYRQEVYGQTMSTHKERLLDHPLFSATQAEEMTRQFALENRAEALLRGQPTD